MRSNATHLERIGGRWHMCVISGRSKRLYKDETDGKGFVYIVASTATVGCKYHWEEENAHEQGLLQEGSPPML